MTDVLDRLRAADPAPATVAPPSEELLARLVAQERGRRSPRRWPLIAATSTAALAVAAVALIGGGRPSVDLAERAYAQTAPSDAVVHSVERTKLLHEYADGTFRNATRAEHWLRGDASHTILQVEQGGEINVYEEVVGADGVLRIKQPSGEIEKSRASDGGDIPGAIEESRTDAVDHFRASFARGELRDAGETTFNGRRARAYVREERGEIENERLGLSPSQTTETFYLDADTGQPLGRRTHNRSETGSLQIETVLDTYERLPPTPENLAKLRWSAR